jgi:hypothetical protein
MCVLQSPLVARQVCWKKGGEYKIKVWVTLLDIIGLTSADTGLPPLVLLPLCYLRTYGKVL